MKSAILIIDPFVSSEYLLKRFTELGYELIAVTTINLNIEYTNAAQLHFNNILLSEGNVEQDLKKIFDLQKKYNICHGIVGMEASLEYAEKLLNLCFPEKSNDPQTTKLRNNKYWMNEILFRKGLPAIEQQLISFNLNLQEKCNIAFNFFDKHNGKVVIKPNSGSAASVGVFSPNKKKDIELYFQEQKNFLFKNADFLIQEKIQGDEFYVDVASYNGFHEISSIGKYCKKLTNGGFEYQYSDNLDLNDPFSIKAKEYVLNCLAALEMNNGLSHIEIMYTNEGFKLIELNPRIAGLHGFTNIMAIKKYGQDQIGLYLNLLNGERNDYSIRNIKNQRLFIFKNKKGIFNSIDLSLIKSLPSYSDHKVIKSKSTTLEKEKQSLIDVVLFVLLEHMDKKTINHDTRILSRLEKNAICLI